MGNVSSTTSNSLSLVASATYNVAKIATEYIYNLVVTPIVKVAETSDTKNRKNRNCVFVFL